MSNKSETGWLEHVVLQGFRSGLVLVFQLDVVQQL